MSQINDTVDLIRWASTASQVENLALFSTAGVERESPFTSGGPVALDEPLNKVFHSCASRYMMCVPCFCLTPLCRCGPAAAGWELLWKPSGGQASLKNIPPQAQSNAESGKELEQWMLDLASCA
ncbi:hypothetical protein CKAH01_16965 [Colletotrichum kahawae]|uniref:Uncharacterized protein n=1 Tax=Colletotrichum kahawae TaxID=34407 RepID=A0AAD9YE81_COLKA|nr:hypothetical protein CKAH01_16965 [Colletotrichum kahawae]